MTKKKKDLNKKDNDLQSSSDEGGNTQEFPLRRKKKGLLSQQNEISVYKPEKPKIISIYPQNR